MDSAHLHLMLNHVPIITTIFSLLILVWGIIRTEKVVINVALAGFILAGIFSTIVFLTGNAAESLVETIEGINASGIGEHESMAGNANIIAIILAVAAIGGFAAKKFKASLFKPIKWAIVVVGLSSVGLFGYTAYLGGQIHHTEIPVIQTSDAESEDGYVEPCNEGQETLGDEFAQ